MKKINYEKTLKNIRETLKKYLIDNNLRSLVVGVSGGADSGLACAIAYPVCKELGVELIGRSISIETNKPDEQERARNIGRYFCTNFREVDLTNEFHVLKNVMDNNGDDCVIDINETETQRKIRLGNIKARSRMIYLYDLAQKNKGLVLSTDNYTELMVGFWTIHGDVGDYGMFQELWKTEVYGMIEHICDYELNGDNPDYALRSLLNAVATDGLGITKSDLDQLLPGWTNRHTTTREGYVEVDDVLNRYLNGNNDSESNGSLVVIERHLRTQFKRNNPINLKREKIVEYL